MIGRKIHQYQITEKLGEGGMGVVYKAEDTKLGRTVALKFLHPDIVANPQEQERLVHEARAAAGLHHPNICTIYEINEFDGQTFIAMAYVDGMTLRDRVLSGRIPVAAALRHLQQIALGLREAHRKGIVHRDIKSANIMVDASGNAIIMDFGLARRSGQTRDDERFSSAGTSAYMSPEQARGEAVDQRTDIWSLGVVLYEMLAGRLPFRGDYTQAVMYSILNENPRPVQDVRADVPRDVARIVARCLEKDPDRRYQSLDALVDALGRTLDDILGVRRGVRRARRSRLRMLGTTAVVVLTLAAAYLAYDVIRAQHAGSRERVPIAVVDFVNETNEPALDGLSGMLITGLEQSHRLSVMTRTRMFDVLKQLGRDNVDRITESIGQEICRATGVRALVIPSIRRFGDLYTIDLKVLDTHSNKYIFTTKEEGQGQERIPELIDRLARDIRIDLNEQTQEVASTAGVAHVTTVNIEAYQQYFEGERLLDRLEFSAAQKRFQSAIAMDSTFALAYYRLAYSEWWSRGQVADARRNIRYAVDHLDRIPEKERYLVRALEAGLFKGFIAQQPIYTEMRSRYPHDKEMLFGLGDSEFHVNNFDSAEVHFRQVLALDPEFDRALQHLTWTYRYTDRFPQMVTTAERWVKVTGSAESYENLARAYIGVNRMDDARTALETARAKAPDSFGPVLALAEYYVSVAHTDSALSLLDSTMKQSESPKVRTAAARTLAGGLYPYLGRFHDAEKLYDETIPRFATEEGDSTALLMAYVGRAFLHFWEFADRQRTVHDVERTLVFPDRFKTPNYWTNLAIAYMLVGDADQADACLARVRSQVPAETNNFYRIFELALSDHCEDAHKLIEKIGVNRLREGVRPVWFMLGRCQLNAGNDSGAITSFRQISEDPYIRLDGAEMVPAALVSLGEAYERNGDAEKAAAAYRRVLDIWKDADSDFPLRTETRRRLDTLVAEHSL